jgi:excisionase family DNA binding protein
MAECLLTTREVAEMLGLSSEAILRRWRAGELPGFRLSTKVLRFRESEVLEWLDGRRVGPDPRRESELDSHDEVDAVVARGR